MLTIEPEITNSTSFADPKTEDKTFLISSGVKSDIKASSIHIKPGTQFKSGSNVHIETVIREE